MSQIVVLDSEIIGQTKPVFLVCLKYLDDQTTQSFWFHKKDHMEALRRELTTKGRTFVTFNGIKFDMPLINAAIAGRPPEVLKQFAQEIIDEGCQPWQFYAKYGIPELRIDHIDLIEVAPGVLISLKLYAGRMGYTSMVDMPFHHDDDLKPKQLKVLEEYCLNDLGVTEALFNKLESEIQLRRELSEEHGINLMSKSDAQVAEAILKRKVGITGSSNQVIPGSVRYTAPEFIKTKNPEIKALIEKCESTKFKINFGNGSPIEAEWMTEPIRIGKGLYKFGLGGLHSQHDKNFYIEATDTLAISDFDVASYYPNIMMVAGLIPELGAGKGEKFLDAYREIYQQRMEAKTSGNKKVADSLKITLNGTFGKLGSRFSAFYSPDLLLAVTITGQLNLVCLIDELEKIKGVAVYSANTDGITVGYPPAVRDKVLKVFAQNAKRTGFIYEETPYTKVAMKDVNNYVAITTKGKVKTKGLYAEKGLMKNPTMQVCSDLAVKYLLTGIRPEVAIADHTAVEDYLAIRSVKGGGVQHTKQISVDDWEGEARNWTYPGMTTKPLTRVSRPAPRIVSIGGIPFGRVARWYMTTKALLPITYVKTGSMVPKTEGAQVCMTLPDRLPEDLNKQWYIEETYRILNDLGVVL